MYQLAVFLHVMSAVVWVGGALFLAMVIIPVSRRLPISPPQSAALLGLVARRFRNVSWAAIAVLVATGLFMTLGHWRVTPVELARGDTWFTEVLRTKLGLVLVVIVLSAVHDFALGPRVADRLAALRQDGAPPEAVRSARRWLVWVARINVLMALTVIALAVLLTRGPPF